jgi:hypothetical protein
MARKRNVEPPLEALQSIIEDLAGHMGGESFGLADRLVALGSARASRAGAARTRLARSLGEDHPRVLELQRREDLLLGVAQRLEDVKRKVDDAPDLRPHEWMAHGRVTLDTGEPLEGMTVRVFDKDRKLDDLLGDIVTDAAGEFRAVYHVRDFADTGEEMPELYVAVFDRRGKPVFSSDTQVRPAVGRSDFFEIILTEQRLEQGMPRSRCTAKTASGERCKNLAIAGTETCSRHTPS